MLIINGGREAMPKSEARVLDCLADPSLSGVVVSGLFLADKRGRGRETDAVVLTPDAVAVLEVKGLLVDAPTGGSPLVLHTSANARWWVDGHQGDPVHVAPGDNSPFDQVGARVFDLKSALTSVPGDTPYISGAVVAVPPAGAALRIEHAGPLPHGLGVLAADRDGGELRSWVGSLRRGRGRSEVFTAERAAAVLAALGVRPPGLAELVAAGFTSDPSAPAAAGAPASAAGADPFATAVPMPTRQPAPAPRSRITYALMLLAGLAVVAAAAILAIMFGAGSDPAETDPGPGGPGPTATAPAGPGQTTTTAPTTRQRTTTPYTPPPPPKACFPFQPSC